MYKLIGKFSKIIWRNNTNDMIVVNFKINNNQEKNKELLNINKSDNYVKLILDNDDFDLKINYEVEIEPKKSLKYGTSYFVKSKIVIYQSDKESAIAFLCSKLFYGISGKTAKKIIDVFDVNFLEDPKKYENELIDLIGVKKAKTIIDGIEKQSSFEKIYRKFIENSLSLSLLETIDKVIPTQQISDFISSDELFLLIEKINEINFIELNKINKVFNLNYSIKLRNKYLILWSIYNCENNGSTIFHFKLIYSEANKYFLITRLEFEEAIKDLIKDELIVFDKNEQTIIANSTYRKEKFIVDKLWKLNNSSPLIKKINYEKLQIDNLDIEQVNILKSVIKNNVSIITGPPGSGKTFIVSYIIKNLNQLGFNEIELLAPTGKAATQISVKSNKNAKTIHSFLKYNKIDFDINEQFPSDASIIVIDEFSMIDIKLFYSILIACPKLKKIIIIGDKNQLPSIKCGYLLNDFLESKLFPSFFLNKIYRQNEESSIIKNALLINEGKIPLFINNTSLIECFLENDFYEKTKEYILKYLSTNENLYNQQILIPIYAGLAGIDNINKMVQEIVNDSKIPLINLNNLVFYKNDKVIQLENDIEKNVFNGEIGYIDSVLYDSNNKKEINKIYIKFNNKIISYSLSEFSSSIKLAYAISIHKFQGSECDDILLLLSNKNPKMITKKLFYTAYTRASKTIVLLSNWDIIKHALQNDKDSLRRCDILKIIQNKKTLNN